MTSLWHWTCTIVAIISTIIAIGTGVLVIWDFLVTRTIKRAQRDTIPIRISRPLSYAQFLQGMDKASIVLNECRFIPDVVIGVHYQGVSFAAILARLIYKPLRMAEIHYASGTRGGSDSVVFDFEDATFLPGKNVLIIDNSMQTGRTLRMVYDAVNKYALHTRTLLIYKKSGTATSEITPDFVLFYSVEPIRFLK